MTVRKIIALPNPSSAAEFGSAKLALANLLDPRNSIKAKRNFNIISQFLKQYDINDSMAKEFSEILEDDSNPSNMLINLFQQYLFRAYGTVGNDDYVKLNETEVNNIKRILNIINNRLGFSLKVSNGFLFTRLMTLKTNGESVQAKHYSLILPARILEKCLGVSQEKLLLLIIYAQRIYESDSNNSSTVEYNPENDTVVRHFRRGK